MGNAQALNPFYIPNDSNNVTTSPSGSQIFDFNDDISVARPNNSSSTENKILCEYCQEYCFPQYHEEHTRICDSNPVNVRINRWFPFLRGNTSTENTSNTELQKTPCNYCNEPCYLKYKEDHQRICPKNPENIKVSCRYCNKTLNLIMYQTHLDSCEDTHHQRRRSANAGPRTERHNMMMQSNLRRSKTNNDIKFVNCERTRSVRVIEKEEHECPICLEKIKSDFDLTNLKCNHKFHKHCINNWSCVQNKCPICRKEFY